MKYLLPKNTQVTIYLRPHKLMNWEFYNTIYTEYDTIIPPDYIFSVYAYYEIDPLVLAIVNLDKCVKLENIT